MIVCGVRFRGDGGESPALLRWDPQCPAEVSIRFVVRRRFGRPRTVDWVFARDVLAAGLLEDSDRGGGDVAGWVEVDRSDWSETFRLRLSPPSGRVVLSCDPDVIWGFVQDCCAVVPQCQSPAGCAGCLECAAVADQVGGLLCVAGW